MSYQEILYEPADGVALITLNRPAVLNAWTRLMEREFHAAVTEADADDKVGLIVVTGAGSGFCAGGDKELMWQLAEHGYTGSAAPNRWPHRPEIPLEHQQRFSYLWSLDKPLVAAINGPAAGVGLILALHCDWRFCTPDAKLAAPFAKLGLPAEQGLAWLLTRIADLPTTVDMLLGARTLSGQEAHSAGLVHRLVEKDVLLTEALAFGKRLVDTLSPQSLRMMRRQIYAALDSTFAGSLALADAMTSSAIGSAQYREAVAALNERRPARFER